MKIKLPITEAVDNLDSIPEHFHPMYAAGQDGKFVLDSKFKGIAETVNNLAKGVDDAAGVKKTANKEAQDARLALKNVRAALKEIGIPEDAEEQALVDSLKEMQAKLTKGDKGAVNWDKMKADLEAAHGKALAAKDAEIAERDGALSEHLVRGAAAQAIAGAKGAPELLMPLVEKAAKVVRENGKYHVRILDEAGDPRGDGKGGFMTVEGYVKELKSSKVYGRAFEPEETRGSGKTTSSSGNPNVRSKAIEGSERSPTQKIADGLGKRRA